jgi:ERCC4-type nuclease
MMKSRIPVFFSSGANDTIWVINALASRVDKIDGTEWVASGACIGIGSEGASSVVSKAGRRVAALKENTCVAMLMQIPGVSAKVADALLGIVETGSNSSPTPSEFFAALGGVEETELLGKVSGLKISDKMRVGPKRAANIIGFLGYK